MADTDPRAVRLLLVDDEEDLVDFLSQRLVKRGFVVETATSGERAVDLARERTFDVAVVDLKLPDMDGIAVIRELKRLQPFVETIMLTGHGSAETALEAGKLQTYRYLLTPCDFEQLIEKIGSAMEIRRAALRARYLEELQELQRRSSAREIKAETERLRRRYEQS